MLLMETFDMVISAYCCNDYSNTDSALIGGLVQGFSETR